MEFKDIINYKLIETTNLSLTVYQVIVFIMFLFFTWLFLKLVKKVIGNRLKKKNRNLDSHYAIFQLIKYFVWIIIIGVALETIGVKFNLIIASSAALLVGVGLGLQNTFNDFVSGFILLFEGSIKVGDILEFTMDYMGALRIINSRYIEKRIE